MFFGGIEDSKRTSSIFWINFKSFGKRFSNLKNQGEILRESEHFLQEL